ncbi:hypothetical protein [Peribacillus asahii]|uniref:Uncharacterized protein n=1 Tax=Peribacillus asahii TaxID=228899 RepID=A0A3Q9RPJ5_9BACI|nr:hypothetical protein [Peribacillus asahii]AZV43789.1 hypothetical protein BAOM_3180 [Peribacillus asahii]USK83530.1 hypothetical protein LIT35_13780 [Peribacillus asahii]
MGKRATITDFSKYVEIFKEIYERKVASITLPSYVIAHSTGEAITLEYLFQYRYSISKVHFSLSTRSFTCVEGKSRVRTKTVKFI